MSVLVAPFDPSYLRIGDDDSLTPVDIMPLIELPPDVLFRIIDELADTEDVAYFRAPPHWRGKSLRRKSNDLIACRLVCKAGTTVALSVLWCNAPLYALVNIPNTSHRQEYASRIQELVLSDVERSVLEDV
ncbi:hypothetical protein K470DRAFT_156766 [Piedraia hortae CBS 480.64]|uniref:F-box domain-containing protein n=1 Tax=Piedraia hortae CBS 480.64 TaxID=1314780 RepID=A0A6A7BRC9_9PEZI|nr:hypothetical protein K470DRAFT_156766 [Piedraia hortae CBS 480.64]